MEIVCVERKAYETLMRRFGELLNRVEAIDNSRKNKDMSEWYDNQDVCSVLNISPRTLQTMRNNGKIPFVREGRKIWYKQEDVEILLKRPCYGK